MLCHKSSIHTSIVSQQKACDKCAVYQSQYTIGVSNGGPIDDSSDTSAVSQNNHSKRDVNNRQPVDELSRKVLFLMA